MKFDLLTNTPENPKAKVESLVVIAAARWRLHDQDRYQLLILARIENNKATVQKPEVQLYRAGSCGRPTDTEFAAVQGHCPVSPLAIK